ncbi:MAG TPA: ABC transporter substrate-binding protein [Candidatus Eremiobacteraceae bacterium]|nr:ABC transporter substrate-binding protein [Candidatus Eremiobacteraceae bacterium]
MRSRALVIAVLCALLSSSCSGGGNGAGSDTLVYGRNKDAVNLDPAFAPDGMSLSVVHNVLEGLTRYKPGSFAVEPALAVSWTHDGSGTVWTFHLRQGVKFQDGSPLDAAAVKFNFDRWRLKSDPYHKGGDFTYYESQFGGFPGIIRDVKAVSPSVVEIDLTKPSAPLLANLAMPSFSISSPRAIQNEGEDYSQHPVGTGPFEVAEWVHDDHITLRAYGDYWGGKPKVATVVLKDIPTADSSLLSLQKGEIDGWEYPTPESLPQIEKDPDLRVYREPANNTMFLAMNELKQPFDDVLVRRAISESIDATAIVQHFYDPGAFAATEFLPPVVWPSGVKTSYPYDPAGARRLLAQAGYPNGFSTTLWFMTTPRPYLPEPERVAEAIQADLKAIGIDAKLEGFEWSNYLYKVQDGEHNLALYGWTGDNGDPDNFLDTLLDENTAVPPGAQNVCFWKNAQFHDLMLRAQTTIDQARRAEIYKKALGILRDQAPLVAIVHTAPPTVFKKSIEGFTPRPDDFQDFNAVSVGGGR